ncbi:unnamed protein product [Rotaria sordida]|uniref:Uncharacterized protein n=1 Tax=Rotaria sordida TaxID=392033 RepID=A0A818KB87_9BILA|nr:unnamed protein product [Rotaria sordida]
MPLFGRRLFHLNNNNDDNNNLKQDNEEIYTIEHTGETFHKRDLYEKLKKAYDLERWTCECTWRASLTHKEAYQSEIETRKSLSSIVPSYFYKPIFDIIYHNVKPLEKLAEEVSIILGQSFVIGETIQFKKKKDNTTVKGIVERIEDNDDPKKRTSERASVQAKPLSDKQMKNVKYSIQLLDEDRIVNNVVPSELQRCNFIPNREKLKTFIRSYAIRLGNRSDSPWIFYDDSIKNKYDIKDCLPLETIEKFKKSLTITLDEILREQERIARKLAEEQAAALEEKIKSMEINNNTSIPNGNFDDCQIILSDDEVKTKMSNEIKIKEIKSIPSTSKSPSQRPSTTKKSHNSIKQNKSPTKPKKQLTLDDMKFTKNSTNHNELLEKSSVTTYDIVIPHSLLQKLDKTRRDRGIDSRFFHRLILQCARTLNDKQRLRLPDEYRSLIQIKYDEIELKRRLSTMNDEEKKLFLQTKRLEQKPIEDFDLPFLKDLPLPKQIQTTLNLTSKSISDLLIICTFLTSCHSLFYLSLNDNISKTTQLYLRSFKFNYLLNTSTIIFSNYFIEILQIFMKLLFKEDENRSNNNDDDDEEADSNDEDNDNDNDINNENLNNNNNNNNNEQIDIDKDIEKIYSIQLSHIPLTPYTCQELTRLYLLKEKDDNNQIILDKLANFETKDLSISEQIDLLLLLVNTITTDNELMSDYFEYLTRTLSEASRERNQLLSERRRAQEEESKEKKLQLKNGDNEKISSKKQTKFGSLITSKTSNGTTNDENQQSSPIIIIDENGDIDNGNDEDLKSVLQRRRQMVAMSKELKEKRELEAQKLQIKQKRQLAIQKAEQIYQDAFLNVQYGFRIKPLGFDRNYNRYWFFRGYPGWIGSDINYSVQSSSSSSQDSSTSMTGEKLIPKDEQNQWFLYDDENIIQQLLQSLNDRGIREHNLLVNLKKVMPFIHTEFEQIKKSKNSIEHQDENIDITYDIISSFKSELEDIETRLRLGSLGGFIINDNLNEWQIKLKQSIERIDLADLLIQLQQTVADKYSTGIFNLPDKKFLQIWINDCRTCKTYSRLYVLMMIFENSITWNKSTLGIKCKICRKKHKDEYIIVCDQCCYGFHQECLRGYSDNIRNSTNDLWYCPACRPSLTSKRRIKQDKQKIDYNENDIYDDDMEIDTTSNISSHEHNNHNLTDSNTDNNDDDDNDNDIEDEEHICSVCGVENDLIQCTQCHQFYHCQCHEPPLRCPPRSTTWICNNCRNGHTNEINHSSRQLKTKKQIKKSKQKKRIQSQKYNGTRRSTRKNYREIDEDEEESDEEDKTIAQRRSKRLRRSDPSPIKNIDNNQHTRRRTRIAKSITSSSSDEDQITNNHNKDSDSEQNEDEEENENNSNDSPSSD